jgi:hypothetical protein
VDTVIDPHPNARLCFLVTPPPSPPTYLFLTPSPFRSSFPSPILIHCPLSSQCARVLRLPSTLLPSIFFFFLLSPSNSPSLPRSSFLSPLYLFPPSPSNSPSLPRPSFLSLPPPSSAAPSAAPRSQRKRSPQEASARAAGTPPPRSRSPPLPPPRHRAHDDGQVTTGDDVARRHATLVSHTHLCNLLSILFNNNRISPSYLQACLFDSLCLSCLSTNATHFSWQFHVFSEAPPPVVSVCAAVAASR